MRPWIPWPTSTFKVTVGCQCLETRGIYFASGGMSLGGSTLSWNLWWNRQVGWGYLRRWKPLKGGDTWWDTAGWKWWWWRQLWMAWIKMIQDVHRCTQFQRVCWADKLRPSVLSSPNVGKIEYGWQGSITMAWCHGNSDAVAWPLWSCYSTWIYLDGLGQGFQCSIYCRQAVEPWHRTVHLWLVSASPKNAKVCLLTLEVGWNMPLIAISLFTFSCQHHSYSQYDHVMISNHVTCLSWSCLSITSSTSGGCCLQSSSNHSSFICAIARCC